MRDEATELKRQHDTARRMVDVLLRKRRVSDKMLFEAVNWYQEVGWRAQWAARMSRTREVVLNVAG